MRELTWRQGRTLLALARGPLFRVELSEMLGGYATNTMRALEDRGLAERVKPGRGGLFFRVTATGRATAAELLRELHDATSTVGRAS